MKDVLLYYNFSYPLGGGDLLPLSFAAELQDVSRVTMAVDSLPGFRRAADAFGIRLDPARVSVVPLFPDGYSGKGHTRWHSFLRNVRLKRLARKADVCISAANITDFGRPAHHFVNLLAGIDPLLPQAASGCNPSLPFWKKMRRQFVESVGRPLSGCRSKRSLVIDPGERVYPNSCYVRDVLFRFYGPFDASVFYPPTLFSPHRADIPRQPLRCLCLGRISPSKRIPDIIEIVDRARRISHADLRLVIAGPIAPGSREAAFLDRAASANPWLEIRDGVFGDAKEELLLSSTFAIHARRDEEFGIAVSEYLVAGLLPIVPGEGGSNEIVGTPDLAYRTIDEAAAILARLATDTEFRNRCRRHCEGRARLFSRDAYLERQRRLLRGILDGAQNR